MNISIINQKFKVCSDNDTLYMNVSNIKYLGVYNLLFSYYHRPATLLRLLGNTNILLGELYFIDSVSVVFFFLIHLNIFNF